MDISSKNTKYEILTDEGFKDFDGIGVAKNDKLQRIDLASGDFIKSTLDHKSFLEDGSPIIASCLKIGTKIKINGGVSEVIKIEEIEGEQNVYDILEVADVHRYYANNILEKNCIFLDEFAFIPNNMAHEFFNSVYPTISAGKTTKLLMVSTPNGMNMFYKMWMDAVNKRSNYVPLEIKWNDVPGRNAAWKKETIKNTSVEQFSQEFECIEGKSEVLIRDIITHEEKTMKIADLYEDLTNQKKC